MRYVFGQLRRPIFARKIFTLKMARQKQIKKEVCENDRSAQLQMRLLLLPVLIRARGSSSLRLFCLLLFICVA